MKEINKIKIGDQVYTLADDGTVAFDAAQALTEEQKAQARQNIGAAAAGETGAGTLIVTVTDEVANHTPAEIYTHVQAGGTAVLLYSNIFFGMTRATTRHAEFSSATDESLIDYVCVNEDGSVERIEHLFVSQEMLDAVTPVFDLAAMGMSAISMTGGSATLGTDTTAIRTALHNGLATFVIPVAEGGAVMPIRATMNAVSTPDGTYLCTGILQLDSIMTLSVMVAQGYVAVQWSPLETGSVTVDDALDAESTNPVQNKVICAQLDQANIVLGQLAASIPSDDHINTLIDAKLGVIENGTY